MRLLPLHRGLPVLSPRRLVPLGLLLLMLLTAHPGKSAGYAAAQTWFVSLDGNDQADCRSAATACQTIAAALTKAAAGNTVQLAPGVYREHVDISRSVTLRGSGPATTVIDGQANGIVLRISSNVLATVTDLMIRNGHTTYDGAGVNNGGFLSLTNVVIRDNVTTGVGGGIGSDGTLILDWVQLINNHAEYGGGLFAGGTLTVTNSLFTENTAIDGGAISLPHNATAAIANTTIDRNTATDRGGGIALDDADVSLQQVTISNNRAGSAGGGIVQRRFFTELTNVTISGNQAGTGGGIANYAEGLIFATNSTIADNTASAQAGASGAGGGIANYAADALVFVFQNTIIANNHGQSNCFGAHNESFLSQGHNLFGDHSCTPLGPGDIVTSDVKLGKLQFNGGPTQTHALLFGSPAIDHGAESYCPVLDQRGKHRPHDGNWDRQTDCDIGAFELQPEELPERIQTYLPLLSSPQ